jgi:hypothetical protein
MSKISFICPSDTNKSWQSAVAFNLQFNLKNNMHSQKYKYSCPLTPTKVQGNMKEGIEGSLGGKKWRL